MDLSEIDVTVTEPQNKSSINMKETLKPRRGLVTTGACSR